CFGPTHRGRCDRSARCRWLWPGRLRRPRRWESRKEVEWSAPLGSDRAGAAVMVRRLPRPDDSRRAEFLLPRPPTVRDRVRITHSARERSPDGKGIISGKTGAALGLRWATFREASTGHESSPRLLGLLEGRHAEEPLELPAKLRRALVPDRPRRGAR